MRVTVDKDEWYPVYRDDDDGVMIDVPDDLWAKHLTNIEALEKSNAQIDQIYHAKEQGISVEEYLRRRG